MRAVAFFLRFALLYSWVTTFGVLAGEVEVRARVAQATAPSTDFTRAEPFELRSAGAATSFANINRNVFSHPSANMSFERQLDFRVGDGLFRKFWASSPTSTKSSDGLGPLYNARACQSCHLKDGRGHPAAPGEKAVSLILRLSIPPRDKYEKSALIAGTVNSIGEPTYGDQLQNFSIQGVPAEGELVVKHERFLVVLNGTEVVSLYRPDYSVADLQYGPFHTEVMMSPRVAPPMIGLGLIEAIVPDGILSFADPRDMDGDGISGRPNLVWSERDKALMVGRFGWKSGEPTIEQQTAHAFDLDMGLSTSFESSPWGDCREVQAWCQRAVHGLDPIEGVEVTDKLLDLVVFYARHLAVPARRGIEDLEVRLGKMYFYQLNCIGCHKPKFVTSREAIEPEHRFQLIWPYSDFLLHDIGEALADGRSEGQATGREWRTAPLWRIGLAETIRNDSRYWHDGRARNLLGAILWHGGEAEVSKQRFMAMTKKKRTALLTFLRSL